jgi:hypothetical protein
MVLPFAFVDPKRLHDQTAGLHPSRRSSMKALRQRRPLSDKRMDGTVTRST